ncbi:MAG: phenylalanine--tRNA ligase subunit beta, partial [Clostridiales bacterium]|nr:phenylalanine--tRNA ligase subunit beta [Clostridiales bacterium]
MLISMNWIKEYVDLSGMDIPELLRRFTLSTAEIDEVYAKGEEVCGVVVGQVLKVDPHPQSGKLHLLQVDTGGKTFACVCGAPNVRQGIKVPFAMSGGSTLEGKVETTEIAGFTSEGMCCSEKELGVSDDHSGLMILDDALPLGADLCALYPIRDVVFEVDNKSLTNRPDLWGHYGIAREFAAITGKPLAPLPQKEPAYQGEYQVPVTIKRPDLCFRYACLRMDSVSRQASPVDLRIRLYYCGMRSLNYLADLTNYIMLEIGQPLHAFDAGKISNIVVQTYEDERAFVTLDKADRRIDKDTLMICDGDTPVAIAGIMGGLDSEIAEGTRGVVLEAANFDATSIRKSATRIGLRTDASARYEKSLDPEMVLAGVKRFVHLMGEMDPGAVVSSKLADAYPYHYPQIVIAIDKAYVDRYSGIDIPAERIAQTLTALGFSLVRDGDSFTVEVPSWRATKDVSLKADLVEELTRIYGYDNFIVKPTKSLLKPVQDSPARTNDRLCKDALVLRHSLHEVHTYLWCDEKKYRALGFDVEGYATVVNGAAENSVIRNSILPSLLIAVWENKDYGDDYGIFEIGRVVTGVDEKGYCIERRTLGVVLYAKGAEEEQLYYKAVSIVNDLLMEAKHVKPEYQKMRTSHNWEHPKRYTAIGVNGKEIGCVCTLHPMQMDLLDKNAAVACIEIDMEDMDGL